MAWLWLRNPGQWQEVGSGNGRSWITGALMALNLVFIWRVLGSHGRCVSRGVPGSLKLSLALGRDGGRWSLQPAVSSLESWAFEGLTGIPALLPPKVHCCVTLAR